MRTTRRKTVTRTKLTGVLRSVKAAIERWNRKSPFRVHLIEDGIVSQDDWIHLMVQPEQDGIRGLDYLNALETIESEVLADGFDQVIVVPTMTD